MQIHELAIELKFSGIHTDGFSDKDGMFSVSNTLFFQRVRIFHLFIFMSLLHDPVAISVGLFCSISCCVGNLMVIYERAQMQVGCSGAVPVEFRKSSGVPVEFRWSSGKVPGTFPELYLILVVTLLFMSETKNVGWLQFQPVEFRLSSGGGWQSSGNLPGTSDF
jgi:hypothetical protein